MKFLCFFLCFQFVFSIAGKAKEYDLSSAIQQMIKHNGELASEATEIDLAGGRIDQANAAFYPKTELYLLGAPIFEERGNAISSRRNYGKWGIFGNLKIQIFQLIYSFGVGASYKEAAKHGLDIANGQFDTKRDELVYRTKQFYYGAQLANDLLDLVSEGKEKIESAIKEATELVQRNKMKRESLFQLKTYYAQILSRYDEAKRGKELALDAFRWTLGLAEGTDFKLDDESIGPERVELLSVKEYTDIAMDKRPELKMLKSGVKATKSLWDAQRKQKRPALFALGFGNIAGCNVRNDQYSVFANDPFNDLSAGAAIGLRLNLDWWTINALSKQSKAQYEKVARLEDPLTDAMRLQVRKAYKEAVDHRNAIDYNKDGVKNAKKWFYNSAMGYGIGLTEAKDLMEALKALFEAELNFNMSIFLYNMALADLTKVTGKEVVSDIEY